jgi:hypothetical protein
VRLGAGRARHGRVAIFCILRRLRQPMLNVHPRLGASEYDMLRHTLCRSDEALRTPAFAAFVDVMQEAGLFLFDARKPHSPTAFDADGVVRERARRRVLRVHL